MEAENSSGDFNLIQRTLSGSPEKKLTNVHDEETESELVNSSGDFNRTKHPRLYKKTWNSSSRYDENEYRKHSGCRHDVTDKNLDLIKKHHNEIRDSQGYDMNRCPVRCESVNRFQRVNVEKEEEREILNELSRKCIAVYNKKHRRKHNYKFLEVIKATWRICNGRYYFITFRACEVCVPDAVKTFQGNYYYCPLNRKNESVDEVSMMEEV